MDDDDAGPGALLVLSAIFFDILTLVPFMGSIVSIGATIFFRIALMHYDIPVNRYLGRFSLTAVGELLPFVGTLPLWTVMVLSIRSEERAKRAS